MGRHAAGQYKSVLDLSKDADPGQPEVADTMKKLAGVSQAGPGEQKIYKPGLVRKYVFFQDV
jgi:hypothetical protein